MRPHDYFQSDVVRTSDEFQRYNIVLHNSGASDDVAQSAGAATLWITSPSEKRIFSATIPTAEAEQLKLLTLAADAVTDYIQQQKKLLDDVTTGVIATYAAAQGLDLETGFEQALQALVKDLRERCENKGVDFDSLGDTTLAPRM